MSRRCMLRWMAAALVIQSLLLFGCDRGFSYHPEGWSHQGKGSGWKKELPGMTLRTWGIFGLNGSGAVSMEFEVTNKTTETMILEAVTLVTRRSSYPLPLASLSHDAGWRTIPPGGGRRMPMMWSRDASEPMPEWLGQSPKVILDLGGGPRIRKIEIPYVPR